MVNESPPVCPLCHATVMTSVQTNDRSASQQTIDREVGLLADKIAKCNRLAFVSRDPNDKDNFDVDDLIEPDQQALIVAALRILASPVATESLLVRIPSFRALRSDMDEISPPARTHLGTLAQVVHVETEPVFVSIAAKRAFDVLSERVELFRCVEYVQEHCGFTYGRATEAIDELVAAGILSSSDSVGKRMWRKIVQVRTRPDGSVP